MYLQHFISVLRKDTRFDIHGLITDYVIYGSVAIRHARTYLLFYIDSSF